MNSERSPMREWRRQVAVGLGRTLSKAETAEVNEMYREYRFALKHKFEAFGGMYPAALVKKFKVGSAK